MPAPTADQTPAVPRLVAALRADLAGAGFTVGAVNDLLGEVAARALSRDQTLPAQRATDGRNDPPAVLLRLFGLALPTSVELVDRALPHVRAAGLVELGLAHGDGGTVTARCDLRPYADEGHDWWLLCDHGQSVRPGPLPADHVPGIGGASLTLASWTPRRPVGRALDVGTGSGIQALHLSTHAEQVVATDISERALAMARLTFALNDLAVDVRRGSLLEPVAGELFDLIVANPPFVITPRSAGLPSYTYRDAGLAGDAVVEQLVRQVGARLRPGGVAQLLGNWEVRRGAGWHERLREWLAGTGLDAWVVQREVQDVAEYAELWSRDGGTHPGDPAFRAGYGGWLDDLAARDVEAIGFGVVTVRRPPGPPRTPWLRLEEWTGTVTGPLGPTVAQTLAAGGALADAAARGARDALLLDTRWQVAADVTEVRYHRPGQEDPTVVMLTRGAGLGRQLQVDTAAAALVGVCDGTLTPRMALAAVADLLGRPAGAVVEEVLPVLVELVEQGFLTPAESGRQPDRSTG